MTVRNRRVGSGKLVTLEVTKETHKCSTKPWQGKLDNGAGATNQQRLTGVPRKG